MISELDKVYSHDKRQELFNILHSEDPDHYSRLWLVGFLKHVGYFLEEICDIIDKECSWTDYDASATFNQVRGVFRGNNHETKDISSQFANRSSQTRDLWFKREDWLKNYKNRPLCTLHYVSCSECPDNARNCSYLAGSRGGNGRQ